MRYTVISEYFSFGISLFQICISITGDGIFVYRSCRTFPQRMQVFLRAPSVNCYSSFLIPSSSAKILFPLKSSLYLSPMLPLIFLTSQLIMYPRITMFRSRVITRSRTMWVNTSKQVGNMSNNNQLDTVNKSNMAEFGLEKMSQKKVCPI